MRKRRAVLSCFAAILSASVVLSLAGASLGFVLESYWWQAETTTMFINPNFDDPGAGDPNSQVAGLRAAMEAWNGKSDFEFVYGGTSATTAVAPDGFNNVHYLPGGSNGTFLAVTTNWFQGSSMTNSDIRFYDTFGDGSDILWHFTPPSTGFWDLTSTAVHELGHAWGCEHSAQQTAIMYFATAQGNVNDTPTLDDLLALTSRYGHPTLSVASVSPGQIGALVGGTTITVQGSGFVDGDTRVFLRKDNLAVENIYELSDVDVLNPGTLTAAVPSVPAGSWPVAVLVGSDQAVRRSSAVSAVPQAPSLDFVDPGRGPQSGGTTVTLLGSRFTIPSDVTVTFGGEEATVLSVPDSSTILVETPPGSTLGLVEVEVTTNGGFDSIASAFRYEANDPAILHLSGNPRPGANVVVEMLGEPGERCALLADGQAGSCVLGGVPLLLRCSRHLRIVHNSFIGGDPLLDALGHRSATLSIPNNPDLVFRTFYMQGVIRDSDTGFTPTNRLQFTIFP